MTLNGENRSQEEEGRFVVKQTADTHFSWLRTRMSIERTLMSWVRTSVSLIGFGFTIVQFFERLKAMPGVAPPLSSDAPRYLGLALIATGTIATLIAIWEYREVVRYLWSPDYRPVAGVTRSKRQTPLFAVAVFLALIGLFAFFAVLMRLV